MSETTNTRAILAWTSPGLTRSSSGAREPGQPDDKWATGTRNSWTRAENMDLMQCYCTRIYAETMGYMDALKPIINADKETAPSSVF